MPKVTYRIAINSSDPFWSSGRYLTAQEIEFETFSAAIEYCAQHLIFTRHTFEDDFLTSSNNSSRYETLTHDTKTSAEVYITSSKGKKWRVDFRQPKDLLIYTQIINTNTEE